MSVRTSPRARPPRGYLLVEAVVGIAISGIVIVSILYMGRAIESSQASLDRSREEEAGLALTLEMAPAHNPGRWGKAPVCQELTLPGAPAATRGEWCFALESGQRTLKVRVLSDVGAAVRESSLEVQP